MHKLLFITVSALIYVVCELHKVAKQSLNDFQKEYHVTNNDMSAFRNAFDSIKQKENQIKQAEQNHESVEVINLLKVEYYNKLQDTKRLFKSRNSAITEHDMTKVEYQYYLLSVPKSSGEIAIDIKDNVERMGVFLTAFGGIKFNVGIAETVARESPDAFLHFVDDDFQTYDIFGFQEEVTWAITISPQKKWITFIFRGSVSGSDWIHNLQANMTDFIPEANSPPFGKVEKGFYDYLYGPTKEGWDERTISKADAIMGMLRGLFEKEEYKDYQLYVTGHSLGGALSTLLACRAALDIGIPKKPVINVSIASPFVGDEEFRRNLQEMERKNAYRHLRISNEDDIVPLIPFISLPFPTPSMTLYKQTGLNFRLYNKTFCREYTFKCSYPKPEDPVNELANAVSQNILLGLTLDILPNHLCPEYRKRLDNSKASLQGLNLEQMYHNSYYTGKLFQV
jgi:hypothetical protein